MIDDPGIGRTAGTGRWAWRVLGIVIGTATVVSLIKSGFAIELHGIPARIHQHYVWLRDTLFEPVVLLAQYFFVEIPSWVKDWVMVYTLVGGAYWRALRADARNIFAALPIGRYAGGRPVLPKNISIWAIVLSALWPLVYLATETEKISWLYGGKAMESIYGGHLRYVRIEDQKLSLIRRLNESMISNLLIISASSGVFFLWSVLSNMYGPA